MIIIPLVTTSTTDVLWSGRWMTYRKEGRKMQKEGSNVRMKVRRRINGQEGRMAGRQVLAMVGR